MKAKLKENWKGFWKEFRGSHTCAMAMGFFLNASIWTFGRGHWFLGILNVAVLVMYVFFFIDSRKLEKEVDALDAELSVLQRLIKDNKHE